MIDMTGIKGYFHGQAPGLPVEANATTLNLTPLTDEQIASLNIHQRVRRIVAEIRSLPKSQWNPEGEFAYAGHDQIIDMLRMLLVKYGVNIYQEPLKFTREATLGGIAHRTTARYKYEVVNTDAPNDRFLGHNWGEALDDSDKGLNKCSTIAEKVFLLRLFKISTFDDPDAQKLRAPAVSQRGSGSGRSEQASPPGKNECQNCRELITRASRGGKIWPSHEVVAASTKQFGKRLCVDCLLAAQANGKSGSHAGTPDSAQPNPPRAARDPEGDNTSINPHPGGPAKAAPAPGLNCKAGV